MKASEIIRQKGWCQFMGISRNGEVCLVQAIDEMDDGAFNHHVQKIKDKLGIGNESLLSQWNDAPERTKEEVIQVLESVGL